MTAKDIRRYQNKKEQIKTIGEFNALGRELQDTFGLTNREAMDLLNGRNELEILEKYEKEKL